MYTSVKLAHYLRSNSSHLVCTIKQNSRELPKLKDQRLSRVGDSIKLIDSQGVVVCKWKDKREVYCLSIITDNTDAEVLVSKRTLDRKLKPNMILDYNKFMGGVDRHDQMRSYYAIGRKSTKWWKEYLYGLLNVIIVNSHICYTYSNYPKMDLFDFKDHLVTDLCDKYSSIKKSISNIHHVPSSVHILIKCKLLRSQYCKQNNF